jgi:hypothetical protein
MYLNRKNNHLLKLFSDILVQILSPARSVLINRKNSCNRYGINKFVNKYESESPSPRKYLV